MARCLGLKSYRSADVGDLPRGWNTEPHTLFAVSEGRVGIGLDLSEANGGDGGATGSVFCGVVGADSDVAVEEDEFVRAARAWW